ncbi:ABC transporter permease [Mucilaginibacter sp. dw_454]|uniref:ABC transporter permease n=1 Tax=Mucilaginibacter sp. dw_454 TaxID=2720079 RepID=UPI001BD3C5DE|nr:ABC transporter permease [Mucilaginibacter sp. dw_454]
MIKNYFKIAWRNLIKNKVSAMINIGGLAIGMAVAMLIGLWIYDELTFDQYHDNYDRVAQVMQHETFSGSINTGTAVSLPVEAELRKSYGADFKHIALSSWPEKHVFSTGDKNISYEGRFMGDEAPAIFSLRMLNGSASGLKDPSAILLSQTAAAAMFGITNAVGKVIKIDNKAVFKVAGVYEDLPENTTLHGMAYMGSWDYYIHAPGNERSPTNWGDNSLFVFVQLADQANLAALSAKIADIKLRNMPLEDKKFKPVIFLQPMAKWHLYSDFKDGINTGGAIQYVWLFGLIGVFILILACINFMNLSTARSERRAKEVGIRKAVGSLRGQLIKQFYCESLLTAAIAFVFSILLAVLAMPWFNDIAGKHLTLLWSNPLFWVTGIGFALFTGVIAGSYPALYLSSFNPIKVLKGNFKAGRAAALPRRILVVGQFTVSMLLIIGTIVVYQQIQFARNRPVGYNRNGLVNIEVTNDDLHRQFAAFSDDLLKSGAVSAVAESSSPVTAVNNNRGDISWQGKDPAMAAFFGNIHISMGYGKAVGWRFTAGRDFSTQTMTDSSAIVLNQTAVKTMSLSNPVGQIIQVGKRSLTVIGVIKDMVMESPYEEVKPMLFAIGRGPLEDVIIRINPATSTHRALTKIAAICKTYSPSVPFSYRFADDDYAKKFGNEERVGKLADSFALLAILISCIGLFGMASYTVEQRVKEIGVRKVLGASVFKLWSTMSTDFVRPVVIAILVATPLAYYLMYRWLQHYAYHTTLSWWIFAATALGSVLLTLITVSYQSIKTAVANPVRSLRSE